MASIIFTFYIKQPNLPCIWYDEKSIKHWHQFIYRSIFSTSGTSKSIYSNKFIILSVIRPIIETLEITQQDISVTNKTFRI